MWKEVALLINYKFDSIGSSSTVTYNHPEFGELTFLWNGNKSSLTIIFVDTCTNCICLNPTIVSCDCSWDAFQETEWHHKTFTKKQIEHLKNETKK